MVVVVDVVAAVVEKLVIVVSLSPFPASDPFNFDCWLVLLVSFTPLGEDEEEGTVAVAAELEQLADEQGQQHVVAEQQIPLAVRSWKCNACG